MTMNKLLEFRTTYLRAVAEAWADPDFGVKLKDHPRAALEDRFKFKWPWSKLDLQVEDAVGTTWDDAGYWIWNPSLQESLTIGLPLDPPAQGPSPRIDDPLVPGPPIGSPQRRPDLETKALADYYRTNAILFGDGQERGALMPAHEGFEEFQVVLLAAMAKAWVDPEFKERLLDEAQCQKALEECTKRDPNDTDPWKSPWKLKFVVKHDTESKWDPGPDPNSGKWNTKERPIILKLCLPPKPADSKSSALALAMYNAAGAEYPFTCCCS